MDNRVMIVLVIAGVLILSLLITVFLLPSIELRFMGAASVAHIRLLGPITSEESGGLFGGPNMITSDDIVEKIKNAEDDSSIKAIMFEINSPGGTVVPSKEISRAISEAEKPTVAWIRDVGASGGYWIASATDHIVADSLSITGSIGVIASGFGLEGLLDKYNITYRQLIAGKYKDAGTPFREMTAEEKQLFQDRLDIIHDEFLQAVANNRNLSMDHVRQVGTGIFYLGNQAHDLGLVDELGGKKEVKEYLKKLLDTKDIKFVVYEDEHGLLDLLTGVSQSFSYYLGKGISQGFNTKLEFLT